MVNPPCRYLSRINLLGFPSFMTFLLISRYFFWIDLRFKLISCAFLLTIRRLRAHQLSKSSSEYLRVARSMLESMEWSNALSNSFRSMFNQRLNFATIQDNGKTCPPTQPTTAQRAENQTVPRSSLKFIAASVIITFFS